MEEQFNHRFRGPVLGAGGNPDHDKQGIWSFYNKPTKLNMPVIQDWPGSISWSVHGHNEYITIESLIDAAKVYATMIIDCCS